VGLIAFLPTVLLIGSPSEGDRTYHLFNFAVVPVAALVLMRKNQEARSAPDLLSTYENGAAEVVDIGKFLIIVGLCYLQAIVMEIITLDYQ
jgi:hypothetical protein